MKPSVDFGTPSLNTPFTPSTDAGELLHDIADACEGAQESLSRSFERIKAEGGLQELYAANEYSRTPRQNLQKFEAAVQELIRPFERPGHPPQFNELQTRRRDVLQQAILREVENPLLEPDEPSARHLEDLLWQAASVAHDLGEQDVQRSERAQLSLQGEGLGGSLSTQNIKRYFKDAQFFTELARQVRNIWLKDR